MQPLDLWKEALGVGARLGLLSTEQCEITLRQLGEADPPSWSVEDVAARLGLTPRMVESFLGVAREMREATPTSSVIPSGSPAGPEDRVSPTSSASGAPSVEMVTQACATTVKDETRDAGHVRGGEVVPERLGNYELLRELGRGAQGAVYLARHAKLGTECAVKVSFIRGDGNAAFLARFRREAAAVSKMGKHPNIVGVHDYGEAGGVVYYAMELVKGRTLAEMLAKRALSSTGAATLLEKVARAVHFAHERGVIHRDLKPANIVIREDGEPQVADFGLARETSMADFLGNPAGDNAQMVVAASDATQAGAMLGTPAYMAPEQAHSAHAVDVRADVYALGAVLYHSLTGTPPHTAATLPALLLQKLRGEIRPLRELKSDVPADIEAICLKCLALKPDARYASCDELADDLGRWRRQEPLIAMGEDPVGRQMGRYKIAAAIQMEREYGLYSATHISLGTPALVRIARGDESARHLRAASQKMSRVQECTAVPRVLDSGRVGSLTYLALESHGGQPLREWASNQPTLRERAEFMENLSRAFALLCARRLAPSMVGLDGLLVRPDREPIIVRVYDWPLGETGEDRNQFVVGSNHCADPEGSQVVHYLGEVLYFLLTGAWPHEDRGADASPLHEIIPPWDGRPIPVPTGLDWICMKALSQEPGEMYSSADALAEDLGRWRRRGGSTVVPILWWFMRAPRVLLKLSCRAVQHSEWFMALSTVGVLCLARVMCEHPASEYDWIAVDWRRLMDLDLWTVCLSAFLILSWPISLLIKHLTKRPGYGKRVSVPSWTRAKRSG